MYFEFYKILIIEEIYNIRKHRKKQLGLTVPRIIAKEEKKSVFGMWLRMMFSLIVTGCTFKEYYNLNFVRRTVKNQKTFITTGSNLKAYAKLNDKSCYHLYLNKNEFNEKYSEFLQRDWISLSQDREQVYSFFKRNDNVIIKPKDGHSGIGIKIVRGCGKLTATEIDNLISETPTGIAEQLLCNHAKINELNETSLNTMRVITVRNGDSVDILFAGIRFGAKGCEIDNISTGGRIAPIDTVSGKICGRSHMKKTVTGDSVDGDDYIGFQIPMWDKLDDFLYRLTAVVPQMRYMAWDIAITENGFAVIEGNHSSGNTVSQAHFSEKEQGLRVKLKEIMKRK